MGLQYLTKACGAIRTHVVVFLDVFCIENPIEDCADQEKVCSGLGGVA